MFEDLYPATARAAKAYMMAEYGRREASPPAAAVDRREPSAIAVAGEGRPLRLTINLSQGCTSEVVIRVGQSAPALTVTLDLDGAAPRPARPEGAP